MRKLAIILQIICIFLTFSGIAIEYYYKANLGFLLITAGTFIFAMSVKVNKRALQRENRQLLNEKKNHEIKSNLGISKNGLCDDSAGPCSQGD